MMNLEDPNYDPTLGGDNYDPPLETLTTILPWVGP